MLVTSKKTKSRQLMVRCDDRLYDLIQKAATQSDMPISMYVRHVLRSTILQGGQLGVTLTTHVTSGNQRTNPTGLNGQPARAKRRPEEICLTPDHIPLTKKGIPVRSFITECFRDGYTRESAMSEPDMTRSKDLTCICLQVLTDRVKYDARWKVALDQKDEVQLNMLLREIPANYGTVNMPRGMQYRSETFLLSTRFNNLFNTIHRNAVEDLGYTVEPSEDEVFDYIASMMCFYHSQCGSSYPDGIAKAGAPIYPPYVPEHAVHPFDGVMQYIDDYHQDLAEGRAEPPEPIGRTPHPVTGVMIPNNLLHMFGMAPMPDEDEYSEQPNTTFRKPDQDPAIIAARLDALFDDPTDP